jgi:hypothetical protein
MLCSGYYNADSAKSGEGLTGHGVSSTLRFHAAVPRRDSTSRFHGQCGFHVRCGFHVAIPRPVRVPRTPFPSMRSHDWPRCSRSARFPRPVQKPTLPNRVTRLRPINGGYAGPVRCWPNSTMTSPRDTRWAATVRFTSGAVPPSGHGAVTSGQLGLPNNDHGCPQERLFEQIKPAPKRGYSPSRKHAFSVRKDPRTDRQTCRRSDSTRTEQQQ